VPEPTELEIRSERTWAYRFYRSLIFGLWYLMFRPKTVGRENIPKSGPVLIAPTHRSDIDFAFTLFMTKRKTFFMSKDSLFRVPILSQFILMMGAFSVKRGSADRNSLDMAQEVLRRGEALVLFPEGTRKEGAHVEHLHDGAMFIASRTRAVVVPVGIGHTQRALPRGAKLPRPVRVTIVIGKPIAAPSSEGRVSRSAVTTASEELRSALEDAYTRAEQM